MTRAAPFTPYADVDDLLRQLLNQMQQILQGDLVGLYLFGSLVMGDFDRGISDIDLLAATASEIDQQTFDRLNRMQLNFIAEHPAWNDRIEIAYLSTTALKTFRTQTSPIGIISPGEPFHIKEAGSDWLINWWMVRERGITLFGPAPASLIDPISKQDFLQTVHEHARWWRTHVYEMRPRKAQAYAILTLCRALYACHYGEQVSKKQAAEWAQARWPEWATLIHNALEWRVARQDDGVDPEATIPDTVRFVHFAIDLVDKASPRA
jgi:hypothetical protein